MSLARQSVPYCPALPQPLRSPGPPPSPTMGDSYTPTTALVPVELFPRIASVALLTGFGATALFVAHQAIGTKKTRNVGRDVALAATASVMLGLGLVFSLLSNGIWL